MKRLHDCGNTYEGQHQIGAGLQCQGFSPLSSCWEAWQHPDAHIAGKGTETSTSESAGIRKRERAPVSFMYASKSLRCFPASDLGKVVGVGNVDIPPMMYKGWRW